MTITTITTTTIEQKRQQHLIRYKVTLKLLIKDKRFKDKVHSYQCSKHLKSSKRLKCQIKGAFN